MCFQLICSSWYSAYSVLNICLLKCCCNFSFAKLMQICSKLFISNISNPKMSSIPEFKIQILTYHQKARLLLLNLFDSHSFFLDPQSLINLHNQPVEKPPVQLFCQRIAVIIGLNERLVFINSLFQRRVKKLFLAKYFFTVLHRNSQIIRRDF